MIFSFQLYNFYISTIHQYSNSVFNFAENEKLFNNKLLNFSFENIKNKKKIEKYDV